MFLGGTGGWNTSLDLSACAKKEGRRSRLSGSITIVGSISRSYFLVFGWGFGLSVASSQQITELRTSHYTQQ